MFKFFKDKLKAVLNNFSKKVEEETGEKVEEKKPKEKKAPEKKAKETKKEPAPKRKERIIHVKEEQKEEKVESREIEKEPEETLPEAAEPVEWKKDDLKEIVEPQKEKGFFSKLTEKIGLGIKEQLTTKRISKEKFNELFWDLEVMLLENNVAIEVIEKIKEDLEKILVDKPIPRMKVEETIISTLRKSVEELFETGTIDIVEQIKAKNQFTILFIGINGSGKTTTIAKFAKMLKDKNLKVVIAAADTFRAASIEQLEVHAERIGVKIIKHSYGSDPAAVAFDAKKYAEAKGMDVILIDTAGRLHSNQNLMQELKKIVRVIQPDLKIFVGESITGNDCVNQARYFNEAIGIDGIILSKADVDEKGGAAISVSFITRKPILYLGTGQEYGDLEKFDSTRIISELGL